MQASFRVAGFSLLPLLALAALVAYFSIASPVFLQPQNIYNILRQSSVLLIVAVGATFIILQGSIDLSIGGIATLAGVVAALVMRDSDLWLGAIVLALVAGVVSGFINGAIFSYGKVPSFLVTLGMMFVLDGVALVLSTGAPIPIVDPAFLRLGTGNLIGSVPTIAVWAFLIYALGILLASYPTKFGRYVYALGGNERVARLSGVPVRKFKLYSFMFSGFVAAFAGIDGDSGDLLAARMQGGVARSGDYLLLDSIAAVVMGGTALTGGVGGPHRTLLGVLIMGVLSNGLNVTGVDPYLQIVVKGGVVIGAVFLTLDRNKIQIMK